MRFSDLIDNILIVSQIFKVGPSFYFMKSRKNNIEKT